MTGERLKSYRRGQKKIDYFINFLCLHSALIAEDKVITNLRKQTALIAEKEIF